MGGSLQVSALNIDELLDLQVFVFKNGAGTSNKGIVDGGGVAARFSAEHRCTSRSPSSCVSLRHRPWARCFQ